MKTTRYISLIIALLSVLSMAAQQQQSQYALYNYRNDGDFNAWLNIDIDSITYSNIGIDSIEYDNIVTQEVWTPDSCYRIPIEAIDSIGFRAPEPVYKEGIFYIEEQHLPYIIDADDLSVTFASSTPYYLLPSNGQILYSDLEEEPFIMGFAGRVVEVNNSTEGIIYKCESVSPSDVYDRYLDVFKVVSSEDEIDDMSELKHSQRKVRRRNIQKDGTIIAPEIKWNVGFKNYLSFDAKISNTFDYVISVGITSKDYIKITHTKKTDYSVKTSVKSDDLVDLLTADESGNKKYSPEPVWLPFSYPLVGCKFLQVYLNCGLYFEAKGSFELSAKLPYSSTSVEEYYFSSDNNWIPTYTESNEGGWPGMNEFLSDGKVEFKLKGSAAFGPIVALGISAWKPKFCSLSVQAKAGLELSGECSVDFAEIAQGEFSVYKMLSEDTKITTGLNVGVELVASVKDKDYKIASYGTTICKREKYLLPRFTTPEMPQHTGMGWGNGLDSLAIYTNPSNDLLLPGKVGIGVYNLQGDVISEIYPIWYFGSSGWQDDSLSYDIRNLPHGESYEVRPLFSLLSLLDIKANPKTIIDIPEPMTLDMDSPLNSVTLKKGEELNVAINGGWGDYSVSSSIESLCSASLETVYNRPHVKIAASSYVTGSAVVTVKDLRAGTTETILVTVTGDAVLVEDITLSEMMLDMQPGGTVTLTATVLPEDAGNKNVAWESSNEGVATVSESGLVTAVGEGSCVITCSATDGSEVYAECQVTVSSGTIPDPGNHAWVDLGLPSGTLWATCNVGANSPEEYGDYFAWGETQPKSEYNWSTYKWMNAGQSSWSQINKYTFADGKTIGCWYSNGEFVGDGLTELLSEDDAATANWGSGWQMPSIDQMNELMDNCSREWTTQGGVNGTLVTGPNGNTIFLPAAGYRNDTSLKYAGSDGNYWSRSLRTDDSDEAYTLYFGSSDWFWCYYGRFCGHCVRPVRVNGKENIPTDGLVAYYPFNGNPNDESGNGNNGIPTSSVVLATGVNGDADGAYQFGGPGNPGHIYVPNTNSMLFTDGATLSAYVKPTSWYAMDAWGGAVSSGGIQCIFAKEHDRYGMAFNLYGNDESLAFGVAQNNKWSAYSPSLTGNYLNRWTHVAYVFNDGHFQMYVDGELVTETESASYPSDMNYYGLYIGKFSDSWYPFNGVIDEVRIYNRALTGKEVRALLQ